MPRKGNFLIGLCCLILAAALRLILSPVQRIEATVNLQTWILYGSISEHIHAVAACVFLVLSIGAMVARKASKAHRLFGKLAIFSLVVACISAAVLLGYLAIQDTGYMYHSLVARNENMALFLMLLSTGIYGGLSGYRWSAFSQSKHDIDLVFGLMAITVSLFGIVMAPLIAFVDPLNTLNDSGFPLTPFMAGSLLIAQSFLLVLLGVDDLHSFRLGQVSHSQRITKHVCRVMTAAGAAVTAVFIVHLGPVLMTNNQLLWTLYVIPPTAFALLTAFLLSRYRLAQNQ